MIFHTVTEREVRRGIQTVSQSRDHCVAYVRHIENMNLSASKSAQLFVDVAPASSAGGRLEVDPEAGRLLYKLREVLLPSRLASSNIRHFDIETIDDEGIDLIRHGSYLNDFSECFYRQVRIYTVILSMNAAGRYRQHWFAAHVSCLRSCML